MLTALAGAVINVILNFVMIPDHGAMGAAVATLISYMAVYVIRAYDTASYLRFPLHTVRLIVNAAVLMLQILIMMSEIRYWYVAQAVLLLFLVLFNGKGIFNTAVRVLRTFFKKNPKKI